MEQDCIELVLKLNNGRGKTQHFEVKCYISAAPRPIPTEFDRYPLLKARKWGNNFKFHIILLLLLMPSICGSTYHNRTITFRAPFTNK